MANKRLNGTIKYWNGRKGFGFIAPENDGEQKQIFVHIKAFNSRKNKPAIGQVVSYVVSTDDQGRTRAEDVMRADEIALQNNVASKISAPIIIISILVIAVALFFMIR